MKTSSEKRLVHVDLLRFINIFFMMMTHVVSRGGWHTASVTSGEWAVLNIYDSLVRFSVPVFVMISGIFFLDPKKEISLHSLFKKYILRIATAFLFWSLLYSLLINLLKYRAFSLDLLLHIGADCISGRYHLWFLYMIAALYLITPFLRKITADKRLTEYFLVLCVLFGMMLPTLRLIPIFDAAFGAAIDKMHLHFIMGYVGAYVSGYYFHTYGLKRKGCMTVYILGILSVVFTAAGTQLLSARAGEPVDILYNNCLITTYLTALAVFLLFRSIGEHYTFSEKAGKNIQKLSRISFGMYLVHDFFLLALDTLLGLNATAFHPALAVPVLTCVVWTSSAVFSWLLSHVPVLNKYVM